jgi:hypothetical protein
LEPTTELERVALAQSTAATGLSVPALTPPCDVVSKGFEDKFRAAQLVTDMMKPYEEMQTRVAAVIKQSSASWAKNIQQITALSAYWHNTFQKQIASYEDAVRRLTEGAASAARELELLTSRFKTTLIACHWPPPTMSLDFADMRRMVEARDSLPADQAEAQITSFMLQEHDSAYVSRRLESWKRHKWIKRRLPILTAIVDAHNQGLYELSIPALLPQIEGIIWDGYGFGDHPTLRQEKDYARLLCNGGLDFLDQVAADFFLNTLLEDFQLGQPLPGLSRHAILHGIDTDYATAANSLKLILLFDYFLNAFGVVSLDNLPTYHKLGCPHVQRGSHHRVVYKSHWAAERAGKKACRTCHPENM